MYEMIARLQSHGLSEDVIHRFELLDTITAREIFETLISLDQDQVNRLNYYERQLRRVAM